MIEKTVIIDMISGEKLTVINQYLNLDEDRIIKLNSYYYIVIASTIDLDKEIEIVMVERCNY